MKDYKFYDDDVIAVNNFSSYGNKDTYELLLKKGVSAIHLHKDDVIKLAKSFGLVVYEADSAL